MPDADIGESMMYRFLSILIPTSIAILGAAASAGFFHLLSLQKFGLFQVIAVFMILALVEMQALKRLGKEKARYLLLDGAIFPFASLGISLGTAIARVFTEQAGNKATRKTRQCRVTPELSVDGAAGGLQRKARRAGVAAAMARRHNAALRPASGTINRQDQA